MQAWGITTLGIAFPNFSAGWKETRVDGPTLLLNLAFIRVLDRRPGHYHDT